MLRIALPTTCCLLLISSVVVAQSPCPAGTPSDKLVCLIPQVYGVNGLPVHVTNVAGAVGVNGTKFQNVLPDSLAPLNSALARQTSVLPLASPSSGLTFTWSAAAKALVPSTDSYGPILGDRADTIGKYKLFLGFSYQYFKFDNIDGVNLGNLPSLYLQENDNFTTSGTNRICSITDVNGDNLTECGYIRDVVTANNKLSLKVNQFTTFVTFGVTDRIDLSLAIPIETVTMNMSSDAAIVNKADATGAVFAHTFDPQCPSPCQLISSQSFSDSRTASGIGDLTLRVKGIPWKGERAAVGLGVDVRIPTGDSLNYLGAGAAGVRPFFVWSYHSRVSPHLSVGYEVNGSSKIAGNILTGTKDKLPSQFTYTAGADVWITKHLTAAFDILGQEIFEARRIKVTQVPEPAACQDINCNAIVTSQSLTPVATPFTGAANATYASIGAKVRPFGDLLITGNVLIKMNNGGLTARTIPLVGVSYTF